VDDLAELAARLRAEAQRTGERRGLVLHGDRQRGLAAAARVLEAADVDPDAALLVGPDPDGRLGVDRVPAERSREVMGTTHAAVILDTHDRLDPNALGRTVGAVDGGGLYLLVTPPLTEWPTRVDGFDRTLAVDPYEVDDVAGHFRTRLVATLQAAEGIARVDVDAEAIEATGLRDTEGETDTPEADDPKLAVPDRRVLAREVYERCRTQDQADTVHALEALLDPGQVVVVEADRGRGKSSAAGLAVGGLLERSGEHLVTAPRRANVDEVFARAREVAEGLGLSPRETEDGDGLAVADGRLVYRPPLEALEIADGVDAVVVDEAAGLPVHVLEAFLERRTPLAFTTTIHGYEGAGRGFSVRLADRLDETSRPVHRLSMDEPIRYAAGDPLEAWSFEALLLDAAPAEADRLPAGAPSKARYRAPASRALPDDEALLREAFGLLVLAHYRTTPSDLARLLDAPNVGLHCLTLDDHVVSVALVAREGGLPEATRQRMYEGRRVPGNLIPDVLTSQLRDADAGASQGLRVLRVATHPARRREGFASHLLDEVRRRAGDDVDWLGTSYGATPELLRFWHQLGYRTVHLSTRRNDTSGEHSALQLAPVTEAGRRLADRSEAWLLRRIPSVLADALCELEPDVVGAALAGLETSPELAIADREWRLVAAAAYGPGVYDQAPRPFRQLALRHLVDQRVELSLRAERLLVRKVLQAQPWDAVTAALGYESNRMAMRALGDAYQPLVDEYGNEAAREEAQRFR